MRNRFDELAKQLGEQALAPCGTTHAQHRINPETLERILFAESAVAVFVRDR